MIKVQRHGNRIRVRNPVDNTFTEMINVTFIEEGRSGGNVQMSESTSFLDSVIGDHVGIGNLRVHTHPVRADKIALFPVGKQMQGHINRALYSRPTMRQQEGVLPRLIDGKPTYFSTSLASFPLDDRDLRLDTSELLAIDPKLLRNVVVGAALVEVLDVPQNQEGVLEEVGPQGQQVQPQGGNPEGQGGILNQAQPGGQGNLGQ